MWKFLLWFFGFFIICADVLSLNPTIAMVIALAGAYFVTKERKEEDSLVAAQSAFDEIVEPWERVVSAADSMRSLSIEAGLSDELAQLQTARQKGDVNSWSEALQSLSTKLSENLSYIEASFNNTIMGGLYETQQFLKKNVEYHEKKLAEQGIVVSREEVARIGVQRHFHAEFEFPDFARPKKLAKIDKDFSHTAGHAGVQLARLGATPAGLVAGGLVLGIGAIIHQGRKSKARRMLEEVTGNLDVYKTQIKAVHVVVQAGAEEARRLVELFVENAQNMDKAAADTDRLRYYVAEGKAMLTMEGIARR